MPEQMEMTRGQMDAAVTEAANSRLAYVEAEAAGFVQTLERLALDPRVDVTKIEKLMEMAERVQRRQAEQAFNGAMATAQKAMRAIATDAYNNQTKSRYATYAALDKALRPIYAGQGFGLSFNTGESADPLMVRVVCLVTHEGGFSRDYHLDMPADGKGAKGGDVMTRTHATGSAVTYGMRYLLKMIFNVAVGEGDDDGQKAGKTDAVIVPEGFETFLDGMREKAMVGGKVFYPAWNTAPRAFRDHITKHHRDEWESLKTAAARADDATKGGK